MVRPPLRDRARRERRCSSCTIFYLLQFVVLSPHIHRPSLAWRARLRFALTSVLLPRIIPRPWHLRPRPLVVFIPVYRREANGPWTRVARETMMMAGESNATKVTLQSGLQLLAPGVKAVRSTAILVEEKLIIEMLTWR